MTDPRQHRQVRSVDGDRITYRCGCVNEVVTPPGAMRCVSKCKRHSAAQRDPTTLDEAYYRELGALDADAPQRYVAELTDALGELPEVVDGTPALEIGCGFSPYCSAIMGAGYAYFGIDPSPWVVKAMREAFGVDVFQDTFDDKAVLIAPDGIPLILAAHCFEHMADAPAAILKAASLLAPRGELWVVIPDDSDPLNSDHLWFFSPTSLRACVEAAGLRVERFAVRQRVEHEKFLYLRAVKP